MTFARKTTIVEPFWKISPVCIQNDTTDANLELTVYSYIYPKVLCLSIIFIFIFCFYRGNCLGLIASVALNFQICAAIKKKSLWFQSIPFSKYPYTLGILDNICFHFKLNAKKGD